MSTSHLTLQNENTTDEVTVINDELVDVKPVKNVMNKK